MILLHYIVIWRVHSLYMSYHLFSEENVKPEPIDEDVNTKNWITNKQLCMHAKYENNKIECGRYESYELLWVIIMFDLWIRWLAYRFYFLLLIKFPFFVEIFFCFPNGYKFYVQMNIFDLRRKCTAHWAICCWCFF